MDVLEIHNLLQKSLKIWNPVSFNVPNTIGFDLISCFFFFKKNINLNTCSFFLNYSNITVKYYLYLKNLFLFFQL
jgi:hypothetical protein